jgi:predicted dehydrogenase
MSTSLGGPDAGGWALGIGIVGCGGAGLDVARAIDVVPGLRLAAAYDPVQTLAEDLATPRGAAAHGSLERLLVDPAVDIVYVGVPHARLAPIAAEALAAGKHVLVEKPVALDVAAIAALRDLAERQNLRLGVMFEFRSAPEVIEARRLIAAGAIGEVELVRIRTIIDKPASYWATGPTGRVADGWRSRRDEAGGGVVLMNAIHQVDTLRFVTGLELVRASAELAFAPGSEVEGQASASLRLSNGALVDLVASASSAGAIGEERIEIDGSAGRLDLPDPYAGGSLRAFLRTSNGRLAAGHWIDVEIAGAGGAALPGLPHSAGPSGLPVLAAFLAGFGDAVRAGTQPVATAADAGAALAAVLAIYAAAEAGHAVTIPLTSMEVSAHA